VIISPDKGLLKIAAFCDVPTSRYGDQVKSKFENLKAAVSSAYGDPQRNFDFLRSGSLWTEPEDWTMGLVKGERNLLSAWHPKDKPNGIALIMLDTKAEATNSAEVVLSYEFEGFVEYENAKQAKANSVF
jgi:hypothetical protein